MPAIRHGIGFLGLMLLMLSAGAAQQDETAVRVSVRPFAELAVYPRLEVPATVRSLNDSRLSAEVTAVVADIPVAVGEVVERGTILLQFDAEDYRLRLQQAQAALRAVEARLDLAEYQLQRTQTLLEREVATEEQLRQRRAEYRGLLAERAARRTELAMAKRNLAKCVVRAPFRAIVRERLVKLGELANPGMPLLRIVDADALEVVAKLQQADVAAAREADEFYFETRQARYPVRLRVIAPVFDERERNREARFVFVAEPALPGAAGKLAWRKPRPHLPPALLSQREQGLGVFIAERGRARFIALPGAREGRPAQVDLPADAAIIVEGRFGLRSGDRLIIR